MRRIVTMTFIAGWFGFLAVSSAMATAAILIVAEIAAPSSGWLAAEMQELAGILRRQGNVGALGAMFEAVAFLVIAALLLPAAWMMRGEAAHDRMRGERLAIACLAAAGLAYGAVLTVSVPVATALATPGGFAFVVAASIVAILVDRFAEIENEPDDTSDFTEAATLIGRRMAQGATAAVHDRSRRDES